MAGSGGGVASLAGSASLFYFRISYFRVSLGKNSLKFFRKWEPKSDFLNLKIRAIAENRICEKKTNTVIHRNKTPLLVPE